MQTKNVNLVQTASHNEVQAMAFRSSLSSTSQDVQNSSQESETTSCPISSSVYLPVPAPNKHIQASDLANGYPDQQTSLGGPTEMVASSQGPRSSSVYQPPPLPPRVGNALGKNNSQSPAKEWPKRDQLCGIISVNGSCGPYKPVPPPKPFAGSQILAAHHIQQHQHQQHQLEGNETSHVHQNGQISYPHILVTEQGQFVTHSSKFPIGDEHEKLVKRFNEANASFSQGIDNPSLISDTSLVGGNSNQRRDLTPNHYAQMRPFDPSKLPPPCIPNGYPSTLHRPPFIHPYQQPENNWQNHMQINSARFTAPSVGQSQERKTCMNGTSHHTKNLRERASFHSSQHNTVIETTAYSPGNSSPHYQEANVAPNDPSFKYTEISGRIPISQTNGTISLGNGHGNNFVMSNGDPHKQGPTNIETNGTSLEAHDEAENKKEDKWGSLKRAGKKYSNLKNMLSNKFAKPEAKASSIESNGSGSTQSKGTSSHDLPKTTEVQSNGNILNSERLHNGENHLHENMSFQRTLTYGSLKTKLEDPPPQRYNPPLLINSERQSERLMRNPNGSFPSHCPYGTQVLSGAKPNGILAQKRAGSCSHLGAATSDQVQPPQSWIALHRSDDNLTRPLASDQSYPERITLKPKDGAHVHFHSSREIGGPGGGSDSGRGTGGGSATEFKGHDTSLESGGSSNRVPLHGHSSGNESEWVDIPETDEQIASYRGILHNGEKYPEGTRTPPLPPLLPEGSPNVGARTSSKAKKSMNSFRDIKKPDILETTEQNGPKKQNSVNQSTNQSTSKGRWNDRSVPPSSTQVAEREPRISSNQIRFGESSKSRNHEWRSCESKKYIDDEDELNSTDAALDLNSVLDGATEVTTDDELASNRGDENYIIRRQLEGLEGMYSEVLKVLGGRRSLRHVDPRLSRRRTHGSVSSLPSSVMSNRGVKERRGKVVDDRLRRPSKDISKTTHKRFQRLESHVVTLARSVAHLSSEMRTQQLMLQEMESIRNDLSALKVSVKPPSASHARGGPFRGSRIWNGLEPNGPPWNNPGRVKKLTHFFGDEPPLVRIFLRKLGYEKYASIFEKEKIGMLELPYMTEDRLHKIGIPLGPRLRILEEARGPIKTDGNLSVYVV